VIAAELLRVTYLHRTQPQAAAETVLSPVQLSVLKAKSTKLPKLTVAWAVEAVARLAIWNIDAKRRWHSGTLERLAEMASMSEGWLLAGQVKSDKQIKSLLKF